MLGFSIYQENYSREYIQKMIDNDIKDAFISINVDEEINNVDQTINFLKEIGQMDLKIIADISPDTFKRFTIEQLKSYKIVTLRLDYGFSLDKIIELYEQFNIVLNASTILESDIEYLISKEVDLTKIVLMHNFYPKEETGLSIDKFKALNKVYHQYGFMVLSFIAGDLIKRGPINKGLPTVEHQRFRNPLVNYYELKQTSDQIFIADNQVTDQTLALFKYAMKGIIPIVINNHNLDSKFINQTLTIRQDSNHLNLRIEESRMSLKTDQQIEPENNNERVKGSITIDNYLSKRYNGEVMISKLNNKATENLNVVGNIKNEYVDLIDYIDGQAKVIFLERK